MQIDELRRSNAETANVAATYASACDIAKEAQRQAANSTKLYIRNIDTEEKIIESLRIDE